VSGADALSNLAEGLFMVAPIIKTAASFTTGSKNLDFKSAILIILLVTCK
jgi:hypothetical protein